MTKPRPHYYRPTIVLPAEAEARAAAIQVELLILRELLRPEESR